MAKDIAFSKDLKQNPIITSNVEYIKGIIYMLFKMRPGEDIYNPTKGLDIDSLVYKNESNLSQYETDIKSQFQLYTDILVSSVKFMTVGDKLTIGLSIMFEGETYNLMFGDTGNDINQIILMGGIE